MFGRVLRHVVRQLQVGTPAVQEHLGRVDAGVRWALLTSSLVVFPAAALFWRARRYIRAEVVT